MREVWDTSLSRSSEHRAARLLSGVGSAWLARGLAQVSGEMPLPYTQDLEGNIEERHLVSGERVRDDHILLELSHGGHAHCEEARKGCLSVSSYCTVKLHRGDIHCERCGKRRWRR